MTAVSSRADQDSGYGALYLPVVVRAVPASMGLPSDDDMAAINKIAPVELKATGVFRMKGTASTDATDGYFTHMDPATSLKRFVKGLKSGSALLDSHDMYRLPIGSSFGAEMLEITKAEGVPATQEVVGDYYIIRGMDVPNSGNTDSYIKGIEGGIFRRMSIGFGGPDMRIVCDVDGLDLWDWDSWHWPGERLEDGTVVTYTVFDADIYETSLVYKNATPGALVKRLQHLVTERRIKPDIAARLEMRYGIRLELPSPLYVVSRGGNAGTEAGAMATMTEVRALLQALQARAGKTLSQANQDKLTGFVDQLRTGAGATIEEVAAGLADMLASASGDNAATEEERGIVADLRTATTATKIVPDGGTLTRALMPTVRAYLEAGEAYRRALIDEAVQARQAVMGQERMDAEAQERYRGRLERLTDPRDLQDERDTWVAQRGGKFQAGRIVPIRQPDGADESVDEDEGVEVRAL